MKIDLQRKVSHGINAQQKLPIVENNCNKTTSWYYTNGNLLDSTVNVMASTGCLVLTLASSNKGKNKHSTKPHYYIYMALLTNTNR